MQILFETICENVFYQNLTNSVLSNPYEGFTDIYQFLFDMDEDKRMVYSVFLNALTEHLHQLEGVLSKEVYENLHNYTLKNGSVLILPNSLSDYMQLIEDSINAKHSLSFAEKIHYKALATQLSIQTTLLVLSALLQSTIYETQDLSVYLAQSAVEHWSTSISNSDLYTEFTRIIDNYVAFKFKEAEFINLCKENIAIISQNIDLVPYGSAYDLFLQTLFNIKELIELTGANQYNPDSPVVSYNLPLYVNYGVLH